MVYHPCMHDISNKQPAQIRCTSQLDDLDMVVLIGTVRQEYTTSRELVDDAQTHVPHPTKLREESKTLYTTCMQESAPLSIAPRL